MVYDRKHDFLSHKEADESSGYYAALSQAFLACQAPSEARSEEMKSCGCFTPPTALKCIV